MRGTEGSCGLTKAHEDVGEFVWTSEGPQAEDLHVMVVGMWRTNGSCGLTKAHEGLGRTVRTHGVPQ